MPNMVPWARSHGPMVPWARGPRALRTYKEGPIYPFYEELYNCLMKLYHFVNFRSFFQKESQDCGANMWSAYNSLTYWSTHTDAKYVDVNGKDQTLGETKSKHTVQVQRQDKIRKLLSTDAWNDLRLVA